MGGNVPRTFICLALLASSLFGAQPVRLIFDTDVGNDIDDALALAMIHRLQSLSEVDLLAVTVTKDCRFAAPYVDLVNTFYGRPRIPVGVLPPGSLPSKDSPMIQEPSEARNQDGSLVFPHKLLDQKSAPDAVETLRSILRKQPDHSVTIAQVGFSTNLARLVKTDRALVERKVKLLAMMAGAFPLGKREFNVFTDIPSARTVFAEWPTPIVASGFEIGLAILYPATSIVRDYSYVARHPVAEAYRLYQKMPYDRPTWDLTAVLYAARPEAGYFGVSEPGKVTVDDGGVTHFEASPQGRVRYLTATPEQQKKVLADLIALSSAPPDRLSKR
jgi:purine nucleosidase